MAWGTEEAWLFLSIADAGGGKPASLDLVIGAADSNNHAIPTRAEVEKAISSLLGAGFIDVNADKFSLTAMGLEVFRRANAVPGRGHITRFLELADEWRSSPPSQADPIPWRLKPGQLEAAVAAHHQRFQEWFKKHRDDRGRE
jgi:hypothetical protein